jgi:ribosomal protein S27AE
MPTTVKMEDSEAQLLREVRDRIMHDGVGKLEAMEVPCPKCGQTMSGVRLTAEHWECHKCGYSQDGFKLGVGGSLALGAVAGAGLVALLWWLSKRNEEE